MKEEKVQGVLMAMVREGRRYGFDQYTLLSVAYRLGVLTDGDGVVWKRFRELMDGRTVGYFNAKMSPKIVACDRGYRVVDVKGGGR